MRIRAVFLAIALITGYASFEISGSFFRSLAIDRNHRDITLLLEERRDELAAARELAQSYHVTASQVADTVAVFERLSAEAPSPLPLLAVTNQALGPGIVIRQIDWLVAEDAGARDSRLALTLDLDASDGGTQDADSPMDVLAERLAATFPDFDVHVTGSAAMTITVPDVRAPEPST